MSFRSPGASITGSATAAGRSRPADCAVIRIGKGRSAPAPAARLILMVIGRSKGVSPIEVGARDVVVVSGLRARYRGLAAVHRQRVNRTVERPDTAGLQMLANTL